VEQLPRTVEKVGVFVHRDAGRAPEIARHCGLTALQIHIQPSADEGAEGSGPLQAVASGEYTKMYPVFPATWFLADSAVRLDYLSLTEKPLRRLFDTIFLDSSTPETPGGTGVTFDWEEMSAPVQELKQSLKIVVAGGLTPGNVAEAIRILKPWGVDVSSGVESSPGKKDPGKVRAFIRAVRETEKN